jgi:hypothetical protein
LHRMAPLWGPRAMAATHSSTALPNARGSPPGKGKAACTPIPRPRLCTVTRATRSSAGGHGCAGGPGQAACAGAGSRGMVWYGMVPLLPPVSVFCH